MAEMNVANTTRSPMKQSSRQSALRLATRPDFITAAALVLLAFLLGIVELADGDIWWHLKTGQLIYERGHVPRTDWFTFTNPDSPWIDLHWGFQLIVAGLWELGGTSALILAKSAAGATTIILGLLATRRGWSLWQSVACWLPALLLYSARYLCRPEIVSAMLLAATLAILFHVRRRPRLVWYLPLIQLIWINMHALFVLGWVVWAFFLADAFSRKWWSACVPASEQGDNRWRDWAGASTLMLVANVLNPYGWRGVMFPLTLFSRIQSGEDRQFYQQLAGEFIGMGDYFHDNGLSVIFRYYPAFVFVVIAAMCLITFIGLLSKRRFSLFRALLLVGFGYLVWQATRNTVPFAIVAGTVICWNAGDWRGHRNPQIRSRILASRFALAFVISVLLFVVPTDLFSWYRRLPEIHTRPRLFGLGETQFWYAHDSVKFLSQPKMPDRVVAMHLGHAATVIFHNGPNQRVFADPRLEVNTKETLTKYLQFKRRLLEGPDGRGADFLLNEVDRNVSKMPALLVTTLECLPVLANYQQWRLVFWDDAAAVFLYEPQARELAIPPADRRRLATIFRRNMGAQPKESKE